MPVQILVRLILKILSNALLSNVAVLALWEAARRTPGVVDDAIVEGLAAALGVRLPALPVAPEEATDNGETEVSK